MDKNNPEVNKQLKTVIKRQIASNNNVKRIRDLSSGILKQLVKVSAILASI